MRVVCVIPARVGSVRLQEKPLQTLGDEPLIRLVARRAVFLGGMDRVLVATDDERVIDAVSGIPGVTGVMTSPVHRNGTERIAEIARRAEFAAPTFVNVQGDEPFVPAQAVEGVRELIQAGEQLATAACPLARHELGDEATVKVHIRDGIATAFGRGTPGPNAQLWSAGSTTGWARHLGLYAYTREALLDWVTLPAGAGETDERLEQLRPLAHGRRIAIATINDPAPPGIDTPDDLAAARQYLETLLEKVSA